MSATLERFQAMNPTVGDMLVLLMGKHESGHLCQLSTWRLPIGLPRVTHEPISNWRTSIMAAGPVLNPIVCGPDQGEILNVVGERVRILADSKATGGTCFIFEELTPPGMGPPMHRHGRDDEYFVVLEGTVKFSMNGKEVTLGPGGFILAPRGSTHAFRNVGTSPSRMIISCTPGGLEGPFREADRLAAEGRINPETLAAAFAKFDVVFVGPPLAG